MKYNELYRNCQRLSEDFPIDIFTLSEGDENYVMPVHWHNEFEIIKIISGEFALYINSELHILKSGDYAFINSKSLHHGEPKDCVYECVCFDLQILKTKFGIVFQKYLEPLLSGEFITIPVPLTKSNEIDDAILKLFDTLNNKDYFYEFKTISSLFVLFELLFENNMIIENSHSRKYMKQAAVVSNLMHYIDEKYAENITLAMLAEKVQLSQNYICKIFKEYAGKTPIEYVNETRINNICRELERGKSNITKIATDNGYNDISYFCKVFRKHMGISAKKYAAQFNA